MFLLQNGGIHETYHMAGERRSNLDVVYEIARGLKTSVTVDFVNAYDHYPGHDLHYAIDDSKIRAMGWSPCLSFEEGLKLTL